MLTSQRSTSDWGRGYDAHAHHALGGPFGQRQRDQRAAEAEHGREYEQPAQAALREMHAENTFDHEDHDAQQDQHRNIGHDEQENALHRPFSFGNAATLWNAVGVMVSPMRDNFKHPGKVWEAQPSIGSARGADITGHR